MAKTLEFLALLFTVSALSGGVAHVLSLPHKIGCRKSST